MNRRGFLRVAAGTGAGTFAVGGVGRRVGTHRPNRALAAWRKLRFVAESHGHDVQLRRVNWPFDGSMQLFGARDCRERGVAFRGTLVVFLDRRLPPARQVDVLEQLAERADSMLRSDGEFSAAKLEDPGRGA